jgi:hypothetical protein
VTGGTDRTSLVAGIVVTGAGLILLGDQTGVLDLSLAWLGPLVLAVVGAILLAAGLEGPRRRP